MNAMSKFIKNFVLIIFIVLFFSFTSHAREVSEPEIKFNSNLNILLTQLLNNHEEIQTCREQVKSAQAQLQQSRALYFPKLDLTGKSGRQRIEREVGNDTNENMHSITLRATQLITDFGKTTNTIARSETLLNQALAKQDAVSQMLMFDGIKAYINIIRAIELLKYAKCSEDRIKELTNIEKILVKKGAGLSSDVLQAKSQLVGAMALRVGAEGELNLAKNRFQALFSHFLDQTEVNQFKQVPFLFEHLPDMLEQAVNIAMENNPELKITKLDAILAGKNIFIARSAFFPALNIFGEAITENNFDGVDGYKDELTCGFDFKYNILNGGGDIAGLSSAMFKKAAAVKHIAYVQRLTKEKVFNSWEQLATLREKNKFLEQQADILKNFLNLAKKERKMGTRSLLAVLNGEVNYINALSAASAARQDTKIAAYNLLFAMGKISIQLFE